MHRFLMLSMALLFLGLAACQGPPPTQIVLVVTATPTPEDAMLTSPTAQSQVAASATTDTQPTETVVTIAGTVTPRALPSVQPSPTAVVSQIQVAEQVFEHGRMFWLQPTDQIWVMIVEEEGGGDWLIFENTFVEGEMETDNSIVPPEGFEQPERGFGKLWRENPDIRDALGWAITPEFGYVTRYEYHADNGYHVLVSLYEEEFRFNEADRTWQLN